MIMKNILESVKHLDLPALVLDREAFQANLNFCLAKSSKPLRLATKSLRCLSLMEQILVDHQSAFAGLLCYDFREAFWLVQQGKVFANTSILIAYPTMQKNALNKIMSSPLCEKLIFMVDLQEHLDLLYMLAKNNQRKISVCFDVDTSLQFLGIYFGVRRSSIKDPQQLEDFIKKNAHYQDWLHFRGLMTYEAQIAGVPDHVFSWSVKNWAVKILKQRSWQKINAMRSDLAQIFKRHSFDLYNAGGTGNFQELQNTASVTDVTIGSGLYAPTLFDTYDNLLLKPAIYIALEVSRRPFPGVYTLSGGGYMASGGLFPQTVPKPCYPKDMRLFSEELVGEVQTPITSFNVNVGDVVLFRPSKAGETTERFQSLHIIDQQTLQHIATYPTYRGSGQFFV